MQMTRGVKDAISQCVDELKILFSHFGGVRKAKALSESKQLKLHLGSGDVIKAGWINIDISPAADISLDLREPLPFADNSCVFVYSEHFLEHLAYPQPAITFLSECFRVLEPGGTLSIGVPDTEWPLMEYAGVQDKGYFTLARERWHPAWCQTRLEQLNFHFRDCGEHRYAYDLETLQKALKSVGFGSVGRRDFDAVLDSEDRRLGTLYVQAIKER